MRTSGNHSDASLSFIPAMLLILMAVALVGGVDDTLRTINEFCRRTVTIVSSWLSGL